MEVAGATGAGAFRRAVLAAFGAVAGPDAGSDGDVAARLADAEATLVLNDCDPLLDACAALADAVARR